MNRLWSGRYFMAVVFTIAACLIAIYETIMTGAAPGWFTSIAALVAGFYFGKGTEGKE